MFISDGLHAGEDVPALLKQAPCNAVHYTGAIGAHPAMSEIIAREVVGLGCINGPITRNALGFGSLFFILAIGKKLRQGPYVGDGNMVPVGAHADGAQSRQGT